MGGHKVLLLKFSLPCFARRFLHPCLMNSCFHGCQELLSKTVTAGIHFLAVCLTTHCLAAGKLIIHEYFFPRYKNIEMYLLNTFQSNGNELLIPKYTQILSLLEKKKILN